MLNKYVLSEWMHRRVNNHWLENYDCQHFLFVHKVSIKNAMWSTLKWRPEQSTKSKSLLENKNSYVSVNAHIDSALCHPLESLYFCATRTKLWGCPSSEVSHSNMQLRKLNRKLQAHHSLKTWRMRSRTIYTRPLVVNPNTKAESFTPTMTVSQSPRD